MKRRLPAKFKSKAKKSVRNDFFGRPDIQRWMAENEARQHKENLAQIPAPSAAEWRAANAVTGHCL